VPHGVEARFQPPSRQQTAALADQLGLRQPYFLHMGTNKPHKNIANLVAAWEQLPEVLRRRYSLVFGGTPDVRYPTAAALAAQYGVSESVHELGAIAEADLPALYGGASGFIFPSLAEGFGLPVLEAMACGCPVACSNVSSLPEVSGEAALLFDPYNASAIARSLLLLAEKPELRSTLRQAGLEHAARYTWQTAATATLAVYQRAIQPRQEV